MRKVNDADQPVNPHSLVGFCADRCYGRMPLNNMHKACARTNADKILNLRILTEYFLTHLKSPKTVQFDGSKAELIINFKQQTLYYTKFYSLEIQNAHFAPKHEIIEHGYRNANVPNIFLK